MSARGRFIALEGVEGAGKSSQIGFLRDLITAAGHDVTVTREPGGTPLAEAIRGVLLADHGEPMPPMTELLLMFAARAAHCRQRIEPALTRGEWVLCDRFVDASYAYQGAARGLGEEAVATLERLALDGLKPDRVLIFDLPVAQGLERTRGRAERNRFDDEAEAFHERVRAAYLERAAAEPDRYRVIDASGSVDEVRAGLRDALGDWL
ncbi:dTMP kinase [Salinisphaera sp. PC39]|uniref:dTMP kinase n=1 Tax=Salinisphaera sp. PC39 TaxID=1304156 RepID=UPI0033402A03